MTTLDDRGPGSLRACAANGDRPRVCVFDIGGTISVDTPIRTGSNLYIAGQTAPGQGPASARRRKLEPDADRERP